MKTKMGERVAIEDIIYGDTDLHPDTFLPPNVRLRIFVDLRLDVIKALRTEAKTKGLTYKELINKILADIFIKEIK